MVLGYEWGKGTMENVLAYRLRWLSGLWNFTVKCFDDWDLREVLDVDDEIETFWSQWLYKVFIVEFLEMMRGICDNLCEYFWSKRSSVDGEEIHSILKRMCLIWL